MKTAIIGGGLMGLALAERLTAQGDNVTVFERERQLGGLTTWHDYGPFFWDRFYHVILPTDTHLIAFLERIGLREQLRWRRTLTGFYVDRRLHSMSTVLEFLRFPPVSLIGKLRLALTILYCARIRDWRRLERISVGTWLERLGGRATYEKIWKPLLLAKLGENYRRVSAVFIWSYVRRMFSARSGSAKKEQLGYVAGGYRSVFGQLSSRIARGGGTLRTGVAITRIRADGRDGIAIASSDREERFDRAVFTGPVGVLRRVADPSLFRADERDRDVEYLGVVCVVLVTKRPMTPYYIVNIADARIPFTGIIGMSNLVDGTQTCGLHLTYLPKYVPSGSPLLSASDEELRETFIAGVRLMLPDFDERDIVSVHVNRAARVQPLQVLRYSRLVPQVASAHRAFFVLNTAQFSHATLNNNEVIGAVDAFMSGFCAQAAHHRPRARAAERNVRIEGRPA